MTTRPSRSSSIPIPPSAARNLESAIPILFSPSPASPPPLRPRMSSASIHRSSDDHRGPIGRSVSLSSSSGITTSSLQHVRPLVGSYSSAASARRTSPARSPPPAFAPRIIRATSIDTSPRDPACVSPIPEAASPTLSPTRTRRPSVSIRTAATGPPAVIVPVPRVVNVILRSPSPSHGHGLSPSRGHGHVGFPPPAYLDYSALREYLHTDCAPAFSAGPRSATEQPLSAGASLLSPAPSPYPFMRRESTPETGSDSTASPPPAGSRGQLTSNVAMLSANPVLRLPTRWSEQDRCTSLTVSMDGRVLTFNGPNCTGERESAAARANHAIPAACGIYYYEVEIVTRSNKGHMSIGLSCGDVRLSRLPGWEKQSWGYHADDGHAFTGQKDGSGYGPTYDAGDVIGCGIDFSQSRMFYTKNGAFLGMVFDNVGKTGEVYPAFGMRHNGEVVRANFGSAPFRYAISDHVRARRDEVWAEAMRTGIEWRPFRVGAEWSASFWGKEAERREAAVSSKEQAERQKQESGRDAEQVRAAEGAAIRRPVQQLILAYLAHHGYAGTARAFQVECVRGRSADAALARCEGDPPDGRRGGEAAMETDDGAGRASGSGLPAPGKPAATEGKGAEEEDSASATLAADLQARMPIVQAVQTGDVDTALAALRRDHSHALAAQGGLLLFRLRCQKFVELVLRASDALKRVREAEQRTKQAALGGASMDGDVDADADPDGDVEKMVIDDPPAVTISVPVSPVPGGSVAELSALAKAALHTALAYGQELEADYKGDARPGVRTHLRRTFGVVAYDDPSRAGGAVGELAGQSARTALAVEVNQAILESQGRPAHPSLETLFRQTSACVIQLGLHGVGAAAFTDVRREFLEG